jgi:hypothetical protein
MAGFDTDPMTRNFKCTGGDNSFKERASLFKAFGYRIYSSI